MEVNPWDYRLKCINAISVHGGNLAADAFLVDQSMLLVDRHDLDRKEFFIEAFPVFYGGLEAETARWLGKSPHAVIPQPFPSKQGV